MRRHVILSLFLRHLYLYKRSLPRLMEIFYWPFLDLLLWGFITLYLNQFKGSLPNFVSFFLGALILWDILFRAQQGISVSFLEDMWARNLLNLFVAPVRPIEYIVSLMLVSIVKLLTAATLLAILAWLFYSFNILVMGISLIPFVINLVVMGWAIGIITTSLILRFGQEAEVLAWGLAFLFQPISAVFYPVSVLPPFLQGLAKMIPASHVFEGMRAVIMDAGLPVDHLLKASLLNAFYITLAIAFFHWNLRGVRQRGLLARIGG